MYKKQMALQKLLCFLAIGISAAMFLYSLGIMTDLYEALYSAPIMSVETKLVKPDEQSDKIDEIIYKISRVDVKGAEVYYRMQEFNQRFLSAGVGLILLSVALFVSNTHVRRRYYIGNYLTTGAFVAAAIGISVWGHQNIEMYKAQFLQIDFAKLKEQAEMWRTAYTESTFWFDVHYVLFGILIAAAVALVLNALWKNSLMRHEAALVQASAQNSSK